MIKPGKQYIGDGVYVNYDGHGISLTTEQGLQPDNIIYLEPEVISALEKYTEKIRNYIKDLHESTHH